MVKRFQKLFITNTIYKLKIEIHRGTWHLNFKTFCRDKIAIQLQIVNRHKGKTKSQR